MASFPYQLHHPFLLDSLLCLPNTTCSSSPPPPPPSMKLYTNNLMDEDHSSCFSQFDPPQDSMKDTTPVIYDNSCVVLSDNEPSVTKKQSTDSSTVVDGDQVTQNLAPVLDKKRKTRNGSTLTSSGHHSKETGREGKSKRQKKCMSNGGEDRKEGKGEKKVADQQPPTGYIHVRARRGQATDSHSLAERVRREKNQ